MYQSSSKPLSLRFSQKSECEGEMYAVAPKSKRNRPVKGSEQACKAESTVSEMAINDESVAPREMSHVGLSVWRSMSGLS